MALTPMPSWPALLAPQVHTVPSLINPTVKFLPEATMGVATTEESSTSSAGVSILRYSTSMRLRALPKRSEMVMVADSNRCSGGMLTETIQSLVTTKWAGSEEVMVMSSTRFTVWESVWLRFR
ncbi:hypothetical protein CE91St43_27990 [Oscillospiraceae bacterium]|nr:hypothetical protein CE91St43_27990 [Oscillospiraceae bacterium]